MSQNTSSDSTDLSTSTNNGTADLKGKDEKKPRNVRGPLDAEKIPDFCDALFVEEAAQTVRDYLAANGGEKGISQEALAEELVGDDRGAGFVMVLLAKYGDKIGKSFPGPKGGVYPPGVEPQAGAAAVTHVEVSDEFVEKVRKTVAVALRMGLKPSTPGIHLTLATNSEDGIEETAGHVSAAIAKLPQYTVGKGGYIMNAPKPAPTASDDSSAS